MSLPPIIVVSGINQARKGLAEALHRELGKTFHLGKPLKDQDMVRSISNEIGRRRTGHNVSASLLMGCLLHYAETVLAKNASPSNPYILNRWCESIRAQHLDLPGKLTGQSLDEDMLDAFNSTVRMIEKHIDTKNILYLYAQVDPESIHSSEPPGQFDEYGNRVFWSRRANEQRMVIQSLEDYFTRIRARSPSRVKIFNGQKPIEGLAKDMAAVVRCA